MSNFWLPRLPDESLWEYWLLTPEVRALRAASSTQQHVASISRALTDTTNAVGQRNVELGQRLVEVDHDVKVLQAMVSSLAESMVTAGMVDGTKLGASFERALQRMFPLPPAAPPPPQAASPYRDAPPPAPPPPPKLLECSRCHAKVPSTRTNVTEDGTVCDDCYAAGTQ